MFWSIDVHSPTRWKFNDPILISSFVIFSTTYSISFVLDLKMEDIFHIQTSISHIFRFISCLVLLPIRSSVLRKNFLSKCGLRNHNITFYASESSHTSTCIRVLAADSPNNGIWPEGIVGAIRFCWMHGGRKRWAKLISSFSHEK